MRYYSFFAVPVVVLLVSAGCSPSGTAPTAGATATQSSATADAEQPLDPATARAIGASTDAFMRAILSGDSESAARLLTTKAARRYAADHGVLTPMGMQVERLNVGEVRLLSESEAAAQCLVQEPGVTATHELCCLLKLEASGWRVCGIASEAGAETPVVISFEDEPVPTTPPTQFVEQPGLGAEAPRTAAAPGTAEIR
ncbi:hypothetical protein Pla108_02010 [Botrimarina colliarenosi]|uniref:Lumazine-binding domain protein n=1 Tax=Botrimarina colliarenosi TaxID=2528001 RepID=A0A5C6AIQ2_9BACT|nr:hypothetical protein [Botrimarina colliarenosi]TWT99266.1 hypothetical protein Pla108_02010 [Botrimarina colliarenosi]